MSHIDLIKELTNIYIRQAEIIKTKATVIEQLGAKTSEDSMLATRLRNWSANKLQSCGEARLHLSQFYSLTQEAYNMNELLLCLLSGGVAAALIKAAESLITWKLNRKATQEDKAEAKEEDHQKAEQEVIEQLKKDVNSLRIGERTILHDRIKFLGRSFIKAEEVDFDDRQDLVDMHSVYHNELGGNGNLDNLMKEVMELPIK